MANETLPPHLEFVPGFPKRLSFWEAIKKWFSETKHFIGHTIQPTERFLPKPTRSAEAADPERLSIENTQAEAYAEVVRRLVQSAEERLDTVRAKGNSLLGFVTLVTPVFAWWLLSGRDRLASGSVAASCSNVIGIFAVLFLGLAIRALLRTQAVVGYEATGIDMLVDTEAKTLKPYDLVEEVRRLTLRWGQLQRWSDVIADHFRGGQRFLAVALFLFILAGGICYFHEAPPTSVVVVSKVTQSPQNVSLWWIVGGALVVVGMTVALAVQFYIVSRWPKSRNTENSRKE